MTKVISFANNKGGSGKSTTCSSIGYALAEQGKKVLLVDADLHKASQYKLFGRKNVQELSRMLASSQ